MVLKDSFVTGFDTKIFRHTKHSPVCAPYHLQDFIDRLNKQQTNILSWVFDFPPRGRAKIEKVVGRIASPFVSTNQRYVFVYTNKCVCRSVVGLHPDAIEEVFEAAKGAKAQLEAALGLEDDSALVGMFMGREPFVKEIKGAHSEIATGGHSTDLLLVILREALQIVDDMLCQGCQTHSDRWVWGRKRLQICNVSLRSWTLTHPKLLHIHILTSRRLLNLSPRQKSPRPLND